MTLPLNGLNMLFSDYMVAVNHHTKLDSDRYTYRVPSPPEQKKTPHSYIVVVLGVNVFVQEFFPRF